MSKYGWNVLTRDPARLEFFCLLCKESGDTLVTRFLGRGEGKGVYKPN